jgi:hypothetical protein
MSAPKTPPVLFNSPLEAGIRTVVILDAFAPEAFDLATLSLLDYYVVTPLMLARKRASTQTSILVRVNIWSDAAL